ncbi:glutathione peroxidase [Colwellia sp. UCD-KL20]|uniref:glutathione peroxidase n=1 Tax=Colwellia sp. UCD-KL20 TaxID=1917165 RepID=UPI000970AC73|nr:glutathione peroxidase [Colwellia sp. UCD-KL20]
MHTRIYQFTADNYRGEKIELSQYVGKVVLIVNTASECGFTDQYKGLQALYEQYNEQGLEILAFPCNQFKQQEKGSNADIKAFCDLQFNIKFDLFSKIDVNGANAHPLYEFLKAQAPGILGTKSIKWNFTKFLINKEGEVVKRFATITKPYKLESAIKSLL